MGALSYSLSYRVTKTTTVHTNQTYNWFFLPLHNDAVSGLKKNEIGEACGTYGARGHVHAGFW
jgi:hypothetical protein